MGLGPAYHYGLIMGQGGLSVKCESHLWELLFQVFAIFLFSNVANSTGLVMNFYHFPKFYLSTQQTDVKDEARNTI
jgi:hypothetical protein